MKSSRQQLLENAVICAGCDDRISSTSASFRVDQCGHIFCVRCTSRLDYYESAATAQMNSCPVCAQLSHNRHTQQQQQQQHHNHQQQLPAHSSSQFYEMFRYPQLSNQHPQQLPIPEHTSQPQNSNHHPHHPHHHLHHALQHSDEDEGFRFQNITEEEEIENIPTHSPNHESSTSSNPSNTKTPHTENNPNNIAATTGRSESAHIPAAADHFDIYSRHSSSQYPSSVTNNYTTNTNNNNNLNTDEIIQEIHPSHTHYHNNPPPQSRMNSYGQKVSPQTYPNQQQQQQQIRQPQQQHQHSHQQQQQQPTKSNTQSFFYEQEEDTSAVQSSHQADHANISTLSIPQQYQIQQQQQLQSKQSHHHLSQQQQPISNSSNNSPSQSSHRSIASPHYYPKTKGNSNRFIAQKVVHSSSIKSNHSPSQPRQSHPSTAALITPIASSTAPSQPPQQQNQAQATLGPLKCKEHDDFIQLYCSHDKQLLCVNCYYENSKKHEGHNIAPVKHSLDQITRENALFQLEAKEKLNAISQSLHICATNRSLLADNYSSLCENVHQEFANLFDLLANQEQLVIDSLTRIFDERISEYDSMLADLNYLNACIHEYRDYSPPVTATSTSAAASTSHHQNHMISESDANYTISLFSIYTMIRNTLKNVDFSFTPITKHKLFSLCDFNRPKQTIIDAIPNLGSIMNLLEIRGQQHQQETPKPIKQTVSTSNLIKSNQHHHHAYTSYSSRKHHPNNHNHLNGSTALNSLKSDKPASATTPQTTNVATMFDNSAKQTPRQISHQSSLLNFGGANSAEQPQIALTASQLNSVNRQGSSPSLRSSYNNGSSFKQINGNSNQKHQLGSAQSSSTAAQGQNPTHHMSYAQTIVNRSSKFSNKKQHAAEQLQSMRDFEKQLTPPHEQRRVQDLVKNLQNVSYYALLEEKYNSLNPTAKHRHSKKAIHPSDSSKK